MGPDTSEVLLSIGAPTLTALIAIRMAQPASLTKTTERSAQRTPV
jgi:hypothetical protein